MEPPVLFSVICDGYIHLLSYQQCVMPAILNLSAICIMLFQHLCRNHKSFAPLKLRLLEIFMFFELLIYPGY